MSRSLLRALPLAGILLTAGTLHFITPRPFDAIMPSAVPEPAHRPLTYLSGAAEIGVAGLLLSPRTRRLGGWLASALLLAVWPANIEAALNGGYRGLSGFAGTASAAWLRVPLQIPLIAWGIWVARREGGDR